MTGNRLVSKLSGERIYPDRFVSDNIEIILRDGF